MNFDSKNGQETIPCPKLFITFKLLCLRSLIPGSILLVYRVDKISVCLDVDGEGWDANFKHKLLMVMKMVANEDEMNVDEEPVPKV